MAETVSVIIEDKRLELISEQIVNFSNADFSSELRLSERRDSIDSIIVGLNLLGEELKFHIDEARQREEELTKALHRLNEAQYLSLIGSWEWNIPENKIEWSDQLYRLYGVERGAFETTYENYLKYIHPEDTEMVNTIVQKAYQDHQPFEFFHRIIRSDGVLRILHSRGEVLTDINGNPIKMSGTAQDVTVLKENEARLQKYSQELEYKNKETAQFSYIASHDLQEPLRTITNYINLFDTDYKRQFDENANLYIKFISGAATRMQTLIHDLLEYNRLGNDAKMEMVDCNVLLTEIKQNLSAAIEENNVTLNISKLPVIEGYHSRLNSLFQNLISNAIKFRKIDVDPIIDINAENKGKDWLFTISDNGIGIEKEYYDRIFKLFQKLHPRNEYQGTGIGLAQCKKIVELRGGKIWVESQLGIGSTFYVSLPTKYIL